MADSTILKNAVDLSEWNSGNGIYAALFMLLNMHSRIPRNEIEMLAIPICDPNNPAYRSIHSCKRDDNTDEI